MPSQENLSSQVKEHPFYWISSRHQVLKAAMHFTTATGKETKTTAWNLTHSESCLENQRTYELKDYSVITRKFYGVGLLSPKPPLIQAKQINSTQLIMECDVTLKAYVVYAQTSQLC